MAEAAAGKKRKSKVAETEGNAAKKVKAETSADRPVPLKSALKKTTKDESKLSGKGVTVDKKETSRPKKDDSKVSAKKAVDSTKPKSKISEKATPTSEDQPPLDIASDDDNTELTTDQTAALLAGFSSDEDDASETDAVPTAKIPSIPSKGLIQKRIKQAIAEQSDPETTPGILYIGRLPHGFYEHQLTSYLSQFGTILNLRLARNKRTGKSQHYAFVEFESAAVAEIVAKTMDRYLLFNHLLQVRRVPGEQVREGMFRGAGKRFKKAAPGNKIERGVLRRGMVREGWEKRVRREEGKRREKGDKLKEMGYEFEMPGLKSVDQVPVKEKIVGEVPAIEEPVVEEKAVEEEKVVKKGKKRAAPVVEEEVVAEQPVIAETKKGKAAKKTKKVVDAAEPPKAKKAKKVVA